MHHRNGGAWRLTYLPSRKIYHFIEPQPAAFGRRLFFGQTAPRRVLTAESRIDCPERGDGMLEVLNTLLWGPGTLALILGTGAWLTLRTGGFPQRNLGWALTLSLGREARRKGRGGVSPFGSLMTALASTVGTGNIVGVAAALVSGGPGALVWMELAAFLGLAAKFAECMLAVKYRHVRRDGTRWGGTHGGDGDAAGVSRGGVWAAFMPCSPC